MKINQYLFATFLLILFLPVISCQEKDEIDYVIEIFKSAKDGNTTNIYKLLDYTFESEEHLKKQVQYLINDLKAIEPPTRKNVKKIINNQDYPAFDVTISTECFYMIGLGKEGEKYKILHLARIK